MSTSIQACWRSHVERARAKNLPQVTFKQGAIDNLTATAPFDAAVGRFVLMYQADPVATLSHIVTLLKPGGLVVIQEPDFAVGVATWPKVALWQQVNHWIVETFRRGGVHYDIGGKLYHLFRQAGISGPEMLEHVSVAGGPAMRPFCENSTGIVSSLLPRMEQFGITTAREVDVKSLADRLDRETRAAEAQITYVPIIAAWAANGSGETQSQ